MKILKVFFLENISAMKVWKAVLKGKIWKDYFWGEKYDGHVFKWRIKRPAQKILQGLKKGQQMKKKEEKEGP